MRAKFGISNSPPSPDIGQNSDGDIFHFRISGQSLIKENCHNSRTSDDIDMKLGPETTFDKRNKSTSKKLTMKSCREIVTPLSFLSIYGQFGAIRKPDSGRIVCKIYILNAVIIKIN